MKKNILICFLFSGLVLALACNPRVTELSKEMIPRLFPQAVQFAQDFKVPPLQIRRTISGQYFIEDGEQEIKQMIFFTSSSGEDGEDIEGAFIVEPDVDSATYNPVPNTSSLYELSPNSVLPSILKLNDSTFLDTDIVIKNQITNLSDSTMVVTGPSRRTTATGRGPAGYVFRDDNQNVTHLKTLWRYQQDSVSLFLGQALMTQ